MNEEFIKNTFRVVDRWVEGFIDMGNHAVNALERIATAQEDIARNDPLKQLDRILGATTEPAGGGNIGRADPTDPFGGRDPFEASSGGGS